MGVSLKRVAAENLATSSSGKVGESTARHREMSERSRTFVVMSKREALWAQAPGQASTREQPALAGASGARGLPASVVAHALTANPRPAIGIINLGRMGVDQRLGRGGALTRITFPD